MNALLFPGQGSQIIGMGSEFYNNFELVKNIFKSADKKLGLKEEFNFDFKSFKYFSGHSLGEYSALVSSGALNFEDAVYLLHERGKAMQNAVPVGEGAMLAVLGLKTGEVNDFIEKEKNKIDICEIANDNASGQVIISGNKKSIEIIRNSLKEQKIKTIPLKVSAPFHCSLMKKAAEEMREKINNTLFKKSSFEIINNVQAKVETDPNKVKQLLINQIFSTVRWRESIIFMEKSGVKNFVEIGPGKALSGMVKRTVSDVNCFSINSIADIKNSINEINK